MVEKIHIELENKKQYNKFERAKPFVAIGILLAYLIIVFSTVIALNVRNSRMKIAVGGSNIVGSGSTSMYYCELVIYNLKADGSTIRLEKDEFELKRGGREYEACGYKTDDMVEIEFDGEYIPIVCDATEKKIKLYFEYGSGFSSVFGGGVVYYDDDRLDSKPIPEALNAERTAYIIIETVGILLIWLMISVVLNNLSYKIGGAYRLKTINEKVLAKLKERNFTITKTFNMHSSKSGDTALEKMMIFVDSKSKKCCFIDYNKKRAFVVDYDDIISYKVIENNGVKVEEEPSLLGLPPTQITKNVCKKLSLVIVMDDMDDTNVVYELIKSSVSMDSASYKLSSDSLIQITSFLDVAKNKVTSVAPKQRFVFCTYCGAKNKEESLRCESCGSPLKD